MRASKHTYVTATAEHRLNILRQEEADRQIEEAEYPTGGHCVGIPAPSVSLRPRHVGLTSSEEHAMWLKDVSSWQGDYLAVLADLGRVRAFIVENGGAIYVPHSYFCTSDLKALCPRVETREHCLVAVLGKPYAVLRDALQDFRENGYDIKGFGDMSVREVADLTGLSLDEASLAKSREFDEPFLLHGDEAKASELSASIQAKGLRYTQGMLHHRTGDNDKGRAVDLLKNLYQQKFSSIVTMGLGDSPVDFPMLERVDYPVLVRNSRGEHDPRIDLPNLIRVEGQGPQGWNTAVLEFMREEL